MDNRHLVRVSVYMNPLIKEALDKLASREGSSASSVARRAINSYIVDAETYQDIAAQARYDFAYADAAASSRELEPA